MNGPFLEILVGVIQSERLREAENHSLAAPVRHVSTARPTMSQHDGSHPPGRPRPARPRHHSPGIRRQESA